MTVFTAQQSRDLDCLESLLDQWLKPPEGCENSKVWEAARYSALGAGKRIRPVFFFVTCRLFGAAFTEEACRLAAAIEMIHTYSLIHDDLPSMDDDDYRRGKPACHVVFGEGTAILAGDLLLNRAYETMFGACVHPPSAGFFNAMKSIAKAAGGEGMVLGQDLDLAMEKRGLQDVTIRDVERMACLKTGALIETAIRSAALLCGASMTDLADLSDVGRSVGLAFQIKDDILDGIEVGGKLGKTRHKDVRDGKKTFVTIAGPEEAEMWLADHTDRAADALRRLERRGLNTAELHDLTRRLMERTY
ncbi:MAG TPA: polyprenyl synthetase family protein [Bacillota bacterium]|nr:polyprenyl synthetase family protein [Bacillota bacterium]